MECQIRLQGPNVRATREVQSSEMKLEFEEDKVSDGFQKWIPIVLVKEAFGLTLLNAFVIGAVAKCYTPASNYSLKHHSFNYTPKRNQNSKPTFVVIKKYTYCKLCLIKNIFLQFKVSCSIEQINSFYWDAIQ